MSKNREVVYCTAKDIQLCLQISLSKAYEIMKEPECKATKIGGTIRVKWKNLDAYLQMAEKKTEDNMKLHNRMNKAKHKH
jgi:threonyl-tRNA synthetase